MIKKKWADKKDQKRITSSKKKIAAKAWTRKAKGKRYIALRSGWLPTAIFGGQSLVVNPG